MVHTKDAYIPIGFEPIWLLNVHVNLRATERQATELAAQTRPHHDRLHWALRALSLTDLTTLAGDDTQSNVQRLCQQAAFPFSHELLMRLRKALPPDARRPQTAAVCVYPSRVADAKVVLQRIHVALPIQIAAVATGFPSGQFSLESRLIEIRFAIDAGATEIDIVLDRNLVLTGQWSRLYEELVQMRTVCGRHVHMKSILAVGECGTLENVYTASMVAMMAGTDFIKTSTGKETVNATLTFGLVMIRAIQEFRRRTGRLVGLKPAGGVRTVDDAIGWMRLILNTLGETFLEPTYFRFGASGLVDNIASVVQQELSAKLVTTTKVAKKQEMFEKYNGTKLDT